MTSSSDGAFLRLGLRDDVPNANAPPSGARNIGFNVLADRRAEQRRSERREDRDEAHAVGLRGASVFRGIEGFGRGSTIHTNRLLDLSGDLPVAIVIIDAAERVLAFVRDAAELWGTGVAVLDEVALVPPHGGDHSG